MRPSDGPTATQIIYLAALQGRPVYAGTAKGRHRKPKSESPAARRRARHKAEVAKRSATVRLSWYCDRGPCAARRGHEGTCAEASGWAE